MKDDLAYTQISWLSDRLSLAQRDITYILRHPERSCEICMKRDAECNREYDCNPVWIGAQIVN